MDRYEVGKLGECFAVEQLKHEEYEIIGQNIRSGHSEFDIIARDDKYIIFIEVKTRRVKPETPDRFGRPARAVNYSKSSFLLRGAEEYLRAHRDMYVDLQPRIDVFEIYADPTTEDFTVLLFNHFKNAVKKH